MPEPPVPQSASQTTGWLGNAPEGDLDALFADPAAPQTPPAAAPQAQTPPAPPAPEEPFLKVATGSVYKTREEAVKGLEEKDRAIERLRQEFVAKNGYDPLTGRQVPAAPQVPQSYMADPKRYYEDLSKAAASGNAEEWTNIQLRLTQEATAPYRQIIQDLGQANAVARLPEPVQKFVNSPDFEKTVSDWPLMREAIAGARNDPRMLTQLSDLYSIVFDRYQVRQLPQLLEAARTASPQTQVPPRPTLTPGTPTPPQTAAVKPALQTSAGRKEIIRQYEESGKADTVWAGLV